MVDSSYSVQNMGMAHKPIKLRDLGDGTFAVAHFSTGAWESAYIDTAGTNVIKSGPGVLGRICVGSAVSLSTITIYDNTAGSGTVLFKITHPLTILSSSYFIDMQCKFNNGLTIVSSGSDDFTVMYA